MRPKRAPDDDFLAAGDTASFELFYRRHFERLLGFFARRTHDAELAADLTAETFAAALQSRHRYSPEKGSADAWLFSIAFRKLADAQRRGYAEDRARRRLAMERLELSDDDIARIERLASDDWASRLVEQLAPDQRTAIRAHVVDERDYDDIAVAMNASQAAIRQRVSRGLAILRAQARVRP